MHAFISHLPILTTFVAFTFAVIIFKRWNLKGGMHHLWWGIGLMAYGAGTTTEALTTLFGWNLYIFKAWYITGALMGGAPLAQGTVYLMLSRTRANVLAILVMTAIVTASCFVIMSPVNMELVETYRLTGRVLAWPWVRYFSPFINLYAFVFLVGGAIISAVRYARKTEMRHRFIGNCAIAFGALLPGVGGTFTRFGYTEVLYVTELVGLLVIWFGYYRIVTEPALTSPTLEEVVRT